MKNMRFSLVLKCNANFNFQCSHDETMSSRVGGGGPGGRRDARVGLAYQEHAVLPSKIALIFPFSSYSLIVIIPSYERHYRLYIVFTQSLAKSSPKL